MRNEEAFKRYLKTPSQVKDYPSHCRGVERCFGNKDVEDIFSTYSLEQVEQKLISAGVSKTYMTGYRAYVKFLESIGVIRASAGSGKWRTLKKRIFNAGEKAPFTPYIQGPDEEGQYVKYKEVPEELQVPGLCKTLECEYLECIFRFAKKIFGEIFDQNFPDPVYVELRKECPSRIYLNNNKYIAEKINELINKGKAITAEEVSKIVSFEDRIAGMFVQQPQPHIEIYFNQYDADNEEEYFAMVFKTLAHEFAHYLEYALCEREIDAIPFSNEFVSEAIADFFGVLYSINRGGKYDINVSKARYALWKKREGSDWPYAYALYFYKVIDKKMVFSDVFADYRHFGCIKKLVDVFSSSAEVTVAYNKLTKG